MKLLCAFFLLFVLGASSAAGQTITEFGPAETPLAIAPGPDGSLWFTEYWRGANKIGRITVNGEITKFPIPTDASIPSGITAGPDGAIWFTEGRGNHIGRITPSGVITEFPVPGPFIGLNAITTGPDGNLWFTAGGGSGEAPDNAIWRMRPSGTVTRFPLPAPGSAARAITVGSDGNLWFTESNNSIGRITTAAAITEFAIPTPSSGASGIVAGPDGALWFTEVSANKIGRITTTGTITEFPIPSPNSRPGVISPAIPSIVAGLDGNVYFTERSANKIGRITTTGTITEFPIPSPDSLPGGITSGPDGAIWFTEWAGQIGRLSISIGPLTCQPDVTTLCLNNSRFRVTAEWRTSDASGTASAVPLTSDSGYFWFFSASNVEVLVKALDGCGFNSRYWVFAAGLTDVEVTLRVTDTQTGAQRTYVNPRGTAFQPIQDTSAFATCP